MSEERFSRIEQRLDELRDFIGEQVTYVHERINEEIQPHVQWWVRPAKATIYTCLVCFVLALGAAGAIQLDVLTDWRNWFTEEIR